MDIVKYEVFLCAVDQGSLSRAAFNMGYTQSGVSHMMKSLENEFGFPLLIRNRAGVSLTKNGEEVIPHIRAIVNANHALQQSVSDYTGMLKGNITIGSLTSATLVLLLPVIKEFHQDYPHIQISLLDGTTQELARMLEENRIDIGFFCYRPHMHFRCVPIYEDPVYAVLPEESQHRKKDSFAISEFGENLFIMPLGDEHYDLMRIIKEADVFLEPPFLTTDTYAALSMVEDGLGYTLIPDLVLKTRDNRVISLPLEPPQSRKICMFTSLQPELPPAARKFVTYCKRSLLPEE